MGGASSGGGGGGATSEGATSSGGRGGGTLGKAVGRRVTRRQSGPPKVYTLKPCEAWEFLQSKGWQYVGVPGKWKMAGPDEGDGPFTENEVIQRPRMLPCIPIFSGVSHLRSCLRHPKTLIVLKKNKKQPRGRRKKRENGATLATMSGVKNKLHTVRSGLGFLSET